MNTSYEELRVTPSDCYEAVLGHICDIFDDAIEEENGAIILRSEENLQECIDSIEGYCRELSAILEKDIICKIEHTVCDNNDWIRAYQESITPIEAGIFYVHPSWYEPKENCKSIIIDPALAFGSGHHATTFGCLQAISRYVTKDDKLLDVGCGSGILGIAAAKLGAKVDICDTDPIAVSSAKSNAELNNVTFCNVWEGSVTQTEEYYSVVVANIVADILILLSRDLTHAVKEEGTLILSGILASLTDKVKKRFNHLTLVEEISEPEWTTLVYRKGK